MAHVTEALWLPAESLLGRPVERRWEYPITDAEMQMVVSSTRGQRRLHDVTLFIFNQDNQVALIRKEDYPPGAWRAPGGGIKLGEGFIEGACREALEETGLEVALTAYLLRIFVSFTAGKQKQPWTTHVAAARVIGGHLATRDPQEIAGVRWGTLAELTGPVARVLYQSRRGLFHYRADLHREVARLLA